MSPWSHPTGWDVSALPDWESLVVTYHSNYAWDAEKVKKLDLLQLWQWNDDTQMCKPMP